MGWGYIMHLWCMTLYARLKYSITCCAGYLVAHLLRKYVTMLDFVPSYQTRKSCRFRASRTSCSLIFSLYARAKSNTRFARAWFCSLATKSPVEIQPGFQKLGYKDSNLEMTESESVALPFGDSPSTIRDYIWYFFIWQVFYSNLSNIFLWGTDTKPRPPKKEIGKRIKFRTSARRM